MQKALFFASALNGGSYTFNGFGHIISVDHFFEAAEAEPPRKKALVVKSVPLEGGKKTTSGHKGCQKTQPSTGAKVGTCGDPTYEPGEGEGQGVDSESESESEDVIHPLTEQDLYVYECYNVDISDGHYNTKTNI